MTDAILDLISKKFQEHEDKMAKKLVNLPKSIIAEITNVFELKLADLEKKHDEKINRCQDEILNLKNELDFIKMKQDDHQDRQLRSTLILRKIPFDTVSEQTWEDTKVVVPSSISNHCPSLRFDQIKQSIERCHRNTKANHENDVNSNNVPSISIKFTSWKDSHKVLNAIININKQKKAHSFLSHSNFASEQLRDEMQLYSKDKNSKQPTKTWNTNSNTQLT